MRKFGLIGAPITHSKSPELFRQAFGDKYSYELIEGADFEKSYQRFLKEFDGVNVTRPFKTLACAKADILSAECEAIGAANILVKTPQGVMAFNSDYSGVGLVILDLLKRHELVSALIVGCGGAGKAACVAAMEMGLKTSIANRSKEKAAAFAESLSDIFGKKRKVEIKGLDEKFEADLVIYTLPLRIDNTGSIKAKAVIEANYLDPCLSDLQDTEYVKGEVWLEMQAKTGYDILTKQY